VRKGKNCAAKCELFSDLLGFESVACFEILLLRGKYTGSAFRICCWQRSRSPSNKQIGRHFMGWRDITVYGLLNLMARRWKEHELRRLAHRLPGLRRGTVLSGPFSGMQFGSGSSISEILPKLIGSYECELHEAIENLIRWQFTTIINIGAADGYYAVGMAVRCPRAQIIAYELNEKKRNECMDVARINRVDDRITILGRCDAESLNAFNLDDILIIVDCEGEEVDILNERMVPKLLKTWLLIELHDALRPGCSRSLWLRFGNDHNLDFISTLPRNPARFPVLNGLRPRQKALALDENRLGVQEWLLISPKG
jgi:hypothetical protein